jgi:hypothetical protein
MTMDVNDNIHGPAIIHRRIKPLYDALEKAGFTLKVGHPQNLRGSGDGFIRAYGHRGFSVEFGGNVTLGIFDDPYATHNGLEYGVWEIQSRRQKHLNDESWFPDDHLYEKEDEYSFWRFRYSDLNIIVDGVKRLGELFGK